MTLQELKEKLTNYWNDKTTLQSIIAVLVVLIVVMLVEFYYTYTTDWVYVVLFFLIGFIACLALTVRQYQNVQKTTVTT